jgi:hypothetical protein
VNDGYVGHNEATREDGEDGEDGTSFMILCSTHALHANFPRM